VIVGLLLLAAELGYRLGHELRRRGRLMETDDTTDALVSALLGLLAFFLAFNIGFALNNFNTRREVIVAESNAIGTAYLRAGYLDETSSEAVRELLREYVDVRLDIMDSAQMENAIARSEAIHGELWAQTEPLAIANPEAVSIGLFIEAVNALIDQHSLRLSAFTTLRIPTVFWVMLGAVSAFSFLLVGIASSADDHRNLLSLITFSLAFGAAILLLVDLDNPSAGLIQLGQGAMVSLQQQIGLPTP
jgi:hypothetical protein